MIIFAAHALRQGLDGLSEIYNPISTFTPMGFYIYERDQRAMTPLIHFHNSILVIYRILIHRQIGIVDNTNLGGPVRGMIHKGLMHKKFYVGKMCAVTSVNTWEIFLYVTGVKYINHNKDIS